MRIGLSELLVVLVVIVAFYDPSQLRSFIKQLNISLQHFAKFLSSVKSDVENPVKDMTQPLQDMKESFDDILNGGKSE